MRKTAYILVLCLLAGATAARAGTPAYDFEAEGVIRADATWSGNVIVYGDVLVPEGVTLTIGPGTTVYFYYTDSSKIEPIFLSMQTELLVRGTLTVKGEPDRPVRFMPAPEEEDLKKPARGDWGGIIFDGKGASSSVIEGADITMADMGVSEYYSSPRLSDVKITDCEYGIYAAGGAPVIDGCVIQDCEYGVVAHGKTKPELKAVKYVNVAQHTLMGEGGK